MGYLLYIDESHDKRDKHIVMAGFGMPITNWKSINFQIQQLKTKYFLNPSLNLKAIRRRKYEDNRMWESLSNEQKENFNQEFYNLICKSNHVVLAALINKEKMNNKNKELLFYLAYGFIIQRYQYFLSEKASFGCIIMDAAESSSEINRLYVVHRKFLSEGVPVMRDDIILKVGGVAHELKDYKKLSLNNIYENLIFLDDKDNNMLQIVDMVAAAISGKFNRNKITFLKR